MMQMKTVMIDDDTKANKLKLASDIYTMSYYNLEKNLFTRFGGSECI